MGISRRWVLAILGIAVVSVGLSALSQLSRITPYSTETCSTSQGAEECFGSINPIYPIVFIISMAGVVLVFLGLFGRGFILGPLFLVEMLLVSFGLLGIIFGYIGYVQPCRRVSCLAYSPQLFEPFILIGAVLVAANTFWYSRSGGLHRMSNQALTRFLGVTVTVVGAILSLFGWMVIGTFAGNSVSMEWHWTYWLQAATGLSLTLVGVSLVSLRSRPSRFGL